jgi:biotin transport system permease protein
LLSLPIYPFTGSRRIIFSRHHLFVAVDYGHAQCVALGAELSYATQKLMKAQDAPFTTEPGPTLAAPPAPPSSTAGFGARLHALDPRCKLLVAAALGLLTWRCGPFGLAAFGLAAGLLAWRLALFGPAHRRALVSAGWFALLWTVMKFCLDLLDAPVFEAAGQALLLGLRLGILLFLGLTLAQAGSPRQYGLALTWALRPALRDRAWRAGLALALMLHYLALCFETYSAVAATVRLRRPVGSAWRRFGLTTQAALRVSSRTCP